MTLLLVGLTASRAGAQACARPNLAATTIHAAMPDVPPMAAQQGISGVVQVEVSLDANSHIVALKIYSSPSALLNAAALAAARQSSFQTAIVNCTPIAVDYLFSVEFDSQPGPRLPLNPLAPRARSAELVCWQPDVDAQIRGQSMAFPSSSAMAKIHWPMSAVVVVAANVDAAGRITDASIRSSPNPLLDDAALTVARRSMFSPALVSCRPTAATVLVRVPFGDAPRFVQPENTAKASLVGPANAPEIAVVVMESAAETPLRARFEVSVTADAADVASANAKADVAERAVIDQLQSAGIDRAHVVSEPLSTGPTPYASLASARVTRAFFIDAPAPQAQSLYRLFTFQPFNASLNGGRLLDQHVFVSASEPRDVGDRDAADRGLARAAMHRALVAAQAFARERRLALGPLRDVRTSGFVDISQPEAFWAQVEFEVLFAVSPSGGTSR
ncbi:MAG: TonB family protein [Vulcanimicrobiaceae bacterium]